MKISSLVLTGFQCFDDTTSVDLDDFTAVIGANGCGKSAVLEALCRLFGISTSLRSIRRSDFHIPLGKTYEDFEELKLSLEVLLHFPELDDEAEPGNAVPECFNQMAIDGEGETPFCRLRLSATWYRTSLPEGEIEEVIQWITTADEPDDDDFKAVRPHERSRIQVLYVPAIRDPAKQLRQASGTILARLMRAAKWSEAGRKAIDVAASSVTNTFREEEAVKLIEGQTQETWGRLQDFPELSAVQLIPLERRIEDLLRHVEVQLTDSDESNEMGIDRLSDGLRSLFYFSLLIASFQIEQQTVVHKNQDEGEDGDDVELEDVGPFSTDALNPPVLTLFAVEEPENHLSAHHLGRVVELLKEVVKKPTAQVILTRASFRTVES